MRAPWPLLLAAGLTAGCQFEATFDGTGYRCDSQHRCPDGTTCTEGVCRTSDDRDGSSPDLDGPAGDDAGVEGSLVAHYRMDDDPSGGTGLDATGRHPAVCEACPILVSGHEGNGWQFDGVNDYMVIPDHDAFHLSEGTISLWVNFAAPGSYNFFGKPIGDGHDNSFLLFTNGNSGSFVINLETGVEFLASDVVGDGEWLHVVVTWTDGGSDRTLRVGGDSISSESGGATISYDFQDLLVGADQDLPEGIVQHLDGTLDDLRIYDRALTPEEIAEL